MGRRIRSSPDLHMREPYVKTNLLNFKVLTTIFSCQPIQSFWNQNIPHTCINSLEFALGMNVPNIIFGIALISLSLGWLRRLPSCISQNIGLAIVYALAGSVVAIGIVRIQCLAEYASSSDFTWDFISVAILTALELNGALICACLPAMSPLLQMCVHGTLKPVLTTSNNTEHSAQPVWPRQRHGPSDEETADLARITGGEASRKRDRRVTIPTSSYSAPGRLKQEPNPSKRKGKRDAADRAVREDMGIGLAPSRRIKMGWATPKESRFSAWSEQTSR